MATRTPASPDRRWILSHVAAGGVGAAVGTLSDDFPEALLEGATPRKAWFVEATAPEKDPAERFKKFTGTETQVVDGALPDVATRITDKLDWLYLAGTAGTAHLMKALDAAARLLSPRGLLLGDGWSTEAPQHLVFNAVNKFAKGGNWDIVAAGPAGQWAMRRHVAWKDGEGEGDGEGAAPKAGKGKGGKGGKAGAGAGAGGKKAGAKAAAKAARSQGRDDGDAEASPKAGKGAKGNQAGAGANKAAKAGQGANKAGGGEGKTSRGNKAGKAGAGAGAGAGAKAGKGKAGKTGVAGGLPTPGEKATGASARSTGNSAGNSTTARKTPAKSATKTTGRKTTTRG